MTLVEAFATATAMGTGAATGFPPSAVDPVLLSILQGLALGIQVVQVIVVMVVLVAFLAAVRTFDRRR